MDSKLKDKVVANLKAIAGNTCDLADHGERGFRLFAREEITFAITGDQVELFDETVRILFAKEKWSTKFSESYVSDQVRDIVIGILRDGAESASAYTDKAIRHFEEYCAEQVVYVPIVGVKLFESDLEIGQIKLIPMTEDNVNDLLAKCERIVKSGVASPDQQESFLNLLRRNTLRTMAGNVVAEFRAVAEPLRARERAEEECRRVLDVLRYAAAALYREKLMVSVALFGEVSKETMWILSLSADDTKIIPRSEIVGMLAPFEFSDSNLEHMNKIGVFALSEILKKDDSSVTDFERILLRGVHWFANATIQREPENKVLSLMTCIETYLTPRDGNPIGTAVAEGVAIVVGAGVENRKELKKRIKQFYGLRSGLSHGGAKAIMDADLNELTIVAGTLTMTLVSRRNEFSSQTQLLEWLEEQKLSAPA